MNKSDVTLNYITLIGVGAVIYFVGYTIAGFHTHAEYKRAKKRHSWFFDNKGQGVVELALILPIFLLVCFGIIEFGRAFMVKNTLQCAAREGARVAAVYGTNSPEVEARMRRILSAARVTPTAITATFETASWVPESKSDINNHDVVVHVTVSADFVIVTGKVLSMFPGTMHLSSTATIHSET